MEVLENPGFYYYGINSFPITSSFHYLGTLTLAVVEIMISFFSIYNTYVPTLNEGDIVIMDNSTLPLTTMMAQTLAPNERSMASTIVLGFAWGFGNMLVSPFGKFADLFGIDAAFVLLAILPLLALPLFLTPPFKMLKD